MTEEELERLCMELRSPTVTFERREAITYLVEPLARRGLEERKADGRLAETSLVVDSDRDGTRDADDRASASHVAPPPAPQEHSPLCCCDACIAPTVATSASRHAGLNCEPSGDDQNNGLKPLVERLREWNYTGWNAGVQQLPRELMQEAADALERMERRYWNYDKLASEEITRNRETIANIRAENERLTEDVSDYAYNLDQFRAENERLREALKKADEGLNYVHLYERAAIRKQIVFP